MPQDPINALQNLASQGTRQMPSQMMPMAGGTMAANNAPPNANVLQNLIHVSLPSKYNQRNRY